MKKQEVRVWKSSQAQMKKLSPSELLSREAREILSGENLELASHLPRHHTRTVHFQ